MKTKEEILEKHRIRINVYHNGIRKYEGTINDLLQAMQEYADQETLPYIVDKNVKLFDELKSQSTNK